MVVEKDKFIKIMKRLIETNDVVNQVNDIFKNSKDCEISDFTNASSLMICHEDLVIQYTGQVI